MKKTASIESSANAEGAESHSGEEAGLVTTNVGGSSTTPIGKTPVAYTVGGTHEMGILIHLVRHLLSQSPRQVQ